MNHFKSTLSPNELEERGVSYPHRHADGSFTPTYISWHGMIQRCTDEKTPAWRRYGGRGIMVHAAWTGAHGFQRFLTDMGERPPGLTLDRVDNNGNYEPGNVRWATRSQQQKNKEPFGGDRCKRGHLFAEVGVYRSGGSGRTCRKCATDRDRAKWKAKGRPSRYKLTPGDVAWIRENYDTVKQKDMVKKFGVSKRTVKNAALGLGRFAND